MFSLLLLLSGLAQAAQTLTGTGLEITYNSLGTWNDSANAQGLRASFDLQLEPGQSTDLRLFLRNGSRAITETWTTPFKAE